MEIQNGKNQQNLIREEKRKNNFQKYNPYEPKPYSRWTMAGMLDLQNELKVAEEFWEFISGKGSYKQLLDIFERVGIELRSDIDLYFANFQK